MAVRRKGGGIVGADLFAAYSKLHEDRTSESPFIAAVRGREPLERGTSFTLRQLVAGSPWSLRALTVAGHIRALT